MRISQRKRSADTIDVEVLDQLRIASDDIVPSATVIFAPIKKPRMKILVEKATELGASSFIPVITQNTDKVCDVDGLATTAIEAAEQCERLSIPTIHGVRTFKALLENMPAGVTIVCAERNLGCSARPMLRTLDELIKDPDSALNQRLSVFIGPEGGFTASEVAELDACPSVRLASLGRGVLRSETAALTALSAILNQREKYKYLT
jgi:16S rRNA (uracil1498-N3)-methyltransferase